MAVKLDLEKAYGSLSWDFIDETLRLVCLPEQLRAAIMTCVTSPSLQVLWNGELIEEIPMGLGIR